MSETKVNEYDYINFLIATSKHFSGLEASKVQPNTEDPPAHDAFNRLLYRLKPSASELWEEAEAQVNRLKGLLILDDSTLDKPYAKKTGLVAHHWSGKHHESVPGISLLTLLWTAQEEHIPCDYRVYYKAQDQKTKNDHFLELLYKAKVRGFTPEYVCFDSWYSSLQNLKTIRSYGWHWFTRLKANRQVNPDGSGNIPLNSVDLDQKGRVVHLKGYGFIQIFKIVVTENHIEYWATSDTTMSEFQRLSLEENVYKIENYHKAIKQFRGIERCQARGALAQRNHIQLSLRAFLRLEVFCQQSWKTWFEAKTSILREAVRAYLANPIYDLKPTA